MKGKKPKISRILIVDDEKNIRITLKQALDDMAVEIDTATNGEEALSKLKEGDFGLVLLDLHMPGMDGMQVLEKIGKDRPDIKIIVITAHGTIDSAVQALKQGVVDFIQKPFTPNEIRELVSQVMQRESTSVEKDRDYLSCLEHAKHSITDKHWEAAREHINKAISLNATRPEAFNLLGALNELRGDGLEAQKNYRAALALDPTCKSAYQNLSRITHANPDAVQRIDLDDTTPY